MPSTLQTSAPRLGRIPHVDLRSLNYPIRDHLTARQYASPRSYTWRLPIVVLDQEGDSCVGHGWAHELAARPGVVTSVDEEYALGIYREAQTLDEWPGVEPTYTGTSVLAGAKAVKSRGLIDGYGWAFTVEDLMVSVAYHGPAVLGVSWTNNMFYPDANGFVRPTGRVVGGHCLLSNGVKIWRGDDGSVDWVESYFLCPNSWGPDWSDRGYCRISLVDMAVLFAGGGEACVPLGRHAGTASSYPLR